MDIDKELPGIIRRYNESVGGVNSDTEGYHETITRVFLHGVRLFLRNRPKEPLHELVNELLLSPMGRRDWPLRFYSPARLFSVEARRAFMPLTSRFSVSRGVIRARGKEHTQFPVSGGKCGYFDQLLQRRFKLARLFDE